MRSSRISFLAVVTAGAGLVGFIGVFADWFSLAYEVSGTKVVLDFYGTADGTGAIAVAASLGALMFGCAYMLLPDPQIRRITALLMVLSSITLLIVSAIGFTRVDEAIGAPNPFLPGVEGDGDVHGHGRDRPRHLVPGGSHRHRCLDPAGEQARGGSRGRSPVDSV